MKKIVYAELTQSSASPMLTLMWAICYEAADCHEWDGDLQSFLSERVANGQTVIPGADCTFTIHDIPRGAFVVVDEENGIPHEMYWEVPLNGEWFFPDEECAESFFGGGDVFCWSREALECVAPEWDTTVEALMERMHESSAAELLKYGIEET